MNCQLYRMASSSSPLALLLLITSIALTWAWPNGAGSCLSGQSSVGDSHLTGSPLVQGTLAKGRFLVYLDKVALTSGTPANFTTGVDHVLKLKSNTSGITFTGILFRLGDGNANTSAALRVPSGASDVKVETQYCSVGVAGITHTDRSYKSSSSMILRLDEKASNLPLDVTVVVVNNDTHGSIWYYSAYTLNAVDGGNLSSTTGSTSGPSSPVASPNSDWNPEWTSGSSDSADSSADSADASLSADSADSADSSSSERYKSSESASNTGGGMSLPSIGFIVCTVILGLFTMISFYNLIVENGYLRRKKSNEVMEVPRQHSLTMA